MGLGPIDTAAQIYGGVQLARAAPGIIRAAPGVIRAGAQGLGELAARMRPSWMAGRGAGEAVKAGLKMVPGVNPAAVDQAATALSGGAQTVGRGIAQPLGATLGREVAPTAGMATEAASGPTAASREALARSLASADEAAAAPPAPSPATTSPADRIKSIRPRSNASPQAREAARVDLELAMDEMKLSASARKALREAKGFEAPSGSAASRQANMRAVEGGAPPGSSASRTKPAPKGELPESWKPKPGSTQSRTHNIRDYNPATGKNTDFESLTDAELKSRRKEVAASVARVGAKRAPVAQAKLEAIDKEIDIRATGQGGKYISKSQGGPIDPAGMHPSHLRAAINKKGQLIRELSAQDMPADEIAAAKAQLKILTEELRRRVNTMGEHNAF